MGFFKLSIKMRFQKSDIFQTIVIDQKVTPSSPDFIKSVELLLKNEIGKEFDLNYVSSDTFTQIENDAKRFKSKLKTLFQSPKVLKNHTYIYIVFLQ